MKQQKGFKRAAKVAVRKQKQKVHAKLAAARRAVRKAELKAKEEKEGKEKE
jgi:hypothetical protein